MKPFVGRDTELLRLEDLSKSGRACLVVMKGRRRIGKSRLAEEFGKRKVFLPFSGLAPVKGVTSQHQRDSFARELSTLFQLPPFTFTDWSDGFAHLSRYLPAKPTVILFDEISWMGAKDPTFVSKFKALVGSCPAESPFSNPYFMWFCLDWIDKNIINSTAFFGRVSLYLELDGTIVATM